MPSREEMWEQIPQEVDVVVIGGGITGAGILRDAARRGLRAVLFEQNDIAYGTSSRSRSRRGKASSRARASSERPDQSTGRRSAADSTPR